MSSVAMGDIPATTNMVSTILTNPVGGCIAANQDFDITLQVANLNAGVFVNPTVAYYTAPQALENGNIVGHVHVCLSKSDSFQVWRLTSTKITVQALGDNLNPSQPPKADIFAFFKGKQPIEPSRPSEISDMFNGPFRHEEITDSQKPLGVDNKGDGNGGLKATVTGGLPAGFFRVCTMSAAANHQCVTMPVAQ